MKMNSTELMEELESLVTTQGLTAVVDALSNVCDYKAGFFQGQDDDRSVAWAGWRERFNAMARVCRSRGDVL